MVDIVDHALALLETEKILHGRQEILRHHDALPGIDINLELLVDLVAPHPGEVVFFRVKEEALQEGPGIGGGRRVAGTELLVNILESALLVLGRILAQRLEKDLVLP